MKKNRFLKKMMQENKIYIILSLILCFFVFAAYEYYKEYFYIFKDPDKIRNLVISYGQYSIIAFIVLQIIQVVVFFIPGEVVQVAGGYIFGTWIGCGISLLGITLGSLAVFAFSKKFGRPLVEKIISNKDIKFFKRISKKGSINYVVFLLYLIPGIPKDALGYICGISKISFRDFAVYSTVARLPGIFISAYFGAKINSGNNHQLIGIAIIMTILFIVGVFKGEKIINGLAKKNS